MSNRRSILVLLIAVAALVAANLMTERGSAIIGSGGRATLVDPSWEISGIRIERKGSPVTVLAKAPDWRLAEPYAASVDEPVVLKMLDALAFQRVTEAMSDAELLRLGRTRADFALEDPVVRISVSGAFGEVTVSIGAPTPEAEGVYASVDGDESVLVVPSGVLSAVDVPVDRFRRRSLFLIGPEDGIVPYANLLAQGHIPAQDRSGCHPGGGMDLYHTGTPYTLRIRTLMTPGTDSTAAASTSASVSSRK